MSRYKPVTCNKCGSNQLFIINSRQMGDYVRRRKECSSCGHRYTSVEIPMTLYRTLIKEKENENVQD